MPSFNIRKDGAVQGGSASYSYDGTRLSYNATVKIKIGFLTKTQSFQGSVAVSEADLAWTNFDEPGEQKRIGNALITVAEAFDGSSKVNFQALGSNASGVAVLLKKVTGLVDMRSGSVRASAFGMTFNLTLDPA